MFGIGFSYQFCLRRIGARVAWFGVRSLYCFEIFDRDHRGRTILTEPGIAYDAQHPGTVTTAGELSDGAEGAWRRVLHHIFGVRTIARQPVRQPIGVVDMRRYHAPEARIVVEAAQQIWAPEATKRIVGLSDPRAPAASAHNSVGLVRNSRAKIPNP